MNDLERRVLYQRFLPEGDERAFVWKYAQAVGGRRPRHFHREPELNLVVRGFATFGVGDRVVNVAAGELLAFPPGQDHVLLDGSSNLYLFAVGLAPELSDEALREGGGVVSPLHVRLGAHELDVTIERAAAIVDRVGAGQLAAELWQRVHWLGQRAAQCAGSTHHVLTRRALRLLARAPELGLSALASELRTHPSEVSRHFHRDVGMTLVRYRTRLRLLHLIRSVDAGAEALMAASTAAGFGSYSQFHRTFQAELGCAPREFFSGLREQMQLSYDD